MIERFFVDFDAPYDRYVVIPTDKSFVLQLVKDFQSRFEGHVIDLPAGTLLVPHDPFLHFIDRLLDFIARTDPGSLKPGLLGYPFPPDTIAPELPVPSEDYFWVSKPAEGFRYGDEMYEYGQVVQLRGAPNDPLLLDLHYVLPVEPTVPLVPCSMCGSQFIQERWCMAHSKKRHGSATVLMTRTEALGPFVDPLTRRKLLELDLRNGPLPVTTRAERAEWREVWRMTCSIQSADGSEVLHKNDILNPENPWHLTLIADSYGPGVPKVESVWVPAEITPTPTDVSAPEQNTAERSVVPARPVRGRNAGSKRIPPPTDLFKKKLEGIVQRLRRDLKGEREVSPQDVYLDQEWREWQSSSVSSTFYRRIGEHGINFPAFLRSLPQPEILSQ